MQGGEHPSLSRFSLTSLRHPPEPKWVFFFYFFLFFDFIIFFHSPVRENRRGVRMHVRVRKGENEQRQDCSDGVNYGISRQESGPCRYPAVRGGPALARTDAPSCCN